MGSGAAVFDSAFAGADRCVADAWWRWRGAGGGAMTSVAAFRTGTGSAFGSNFGSAFAAMPVGGLADTLVPMGFGALVPAGVRVVVVVVGAFTTAGGVGAGVAVTVAWTSVRFRIPSQPRAASAHSAQTEAPAR